MSEIPDQTVSNQPAANDGMDPMRLRGGVDLDYNRNTANYRCGSYYCNSGPYHCDTGGGDTCTGMVTCCITTPCICCLGGTWGLLTCGKGF